MLKLDLGCGDNKKPNYVGVDRGGNPDFTCDISRDRLPFPDLSAEEVYSSHCFEHVEPNRLPHVFQEITRVCSDGARVEIWHPHAFHRDAHVFGHISYLSESIYEHVGCIYRNVWRANFGAQWILDEIRYSVESPVLDDLRKANIDLDFAIGYMHDIIKEVGIFMTIDRSDEARPTSYRRYACQGRSEIIAELRPWPRIQPSSGQPNTPFSPTSLSAPGKTEYRERPPASQPSVTPTSTGQINGHDQFLTRMRQQPRLRILELGTKRIEGQPSTIRRSWAHPDSDYIGVDFEPGGDVDVVADGEALSEVFGERCFDLVLSCAVYEHLKHPWLVTNEIAKVLKSGGRVLIVTVHTFPLHAFPFDYYRFSADGLTVLCQDAGLKVLDAGYHFPARIFSDEVPGNENAPAFLNSWIVAERCAETSPAAVATPER